MKNPNGNALEQGPRRTTRLRRVCGWICAVCIGLGAGGAYPARADVFQWPEEWVAFGPIPPDAAMAAGGLPDRTALLDNAILRTVPEAIEVDGQRFTGRPASFKYGQIDFKRFFLGDHGRAHLRGERVYLVARVTTSEPRRVRIGAGADWWMQWWLNGKPLFDTLKTTNIHAPVRMDNHVFDVDLPAGENVLAVFVAAGSGGWTLAAGGPAELAEGLEPPSESGYRDQMEAGRRILSAAPLSAASAAPNSTEALVAFRRAAELAATDVERARARLEMGRVMLRNVKERDYESIHSVFTGILTLPDAGDEVRAEAWIGLAETRLLEHQYPEARAACEQARMTTGDPHVQALAQMTLARTYFQERDYPSAAEHIRRVLDMPDLDRQMEWEARSWMTALEILPVLNTDRPRVWSSEENWPEIRAYTRDREQARFERMAAMVRDTTLEEITVGNWSQLAAEAAFVYRMTGEEQTLDKARRMLGATADYFHQRNPADYSAAPRIAWSAAMDWIWSDLPPSERLALAEAMLDYAWTFYGETKLRGRLASWPHYYTAGMYWYVGLALLDPELDDLRYARAMTLLGAGLQHHRDRIRSLLERSGEDGVWQTNLDYDFGAVPAMMFTFFYSLQPAFGVEAPTPWAAAGLDPEYALRHAVDFGQNRFYYFNWAGHSNGSWGFGSMHSSDLYDYLLNYLHFFGERRPRDARIAAHLRKRMIETGAGPAELWDRYPVFHFLRTGLAEAPEGADLPADLPVGRYYEKVGLVLASSGFGPDETYLLFAPGGGPHQPRVRADMDAGHFSLYRKGHMALDTGTRFAMPHSANYRHQTVAHNCVLIRMPGERFPPSQTGPVISNAGGQNRAPSFARVLAFESSDAYVYAASDLTPTYHEEKCAQMVRQIVFLSPRHLVVFDRVTSVNAEYPKTWLLHTSNEPAMAGDTFHADQDRGRIFCRTLLPEDAVLEPIGGPAREFWADGRNWPVTNAMQAPEAGDWWRRFGRGHTSPPEGMGRWRVEVRPGTPREEDYFLHLIELADAEVGAMTDTGLETDEATATLSFTASGREIILRFNKTGDTGGHIRISENGRVLADRALARDVIP